MMAGSPLEGFQEIASNRTIADVERNPCQASQS